MQSRTIILILLIISLSLGLSAMEKLSPDIKLPNPLCQFRIESSELAVLEYRQASTEVSILSADAKLKRCSEFEGRKDLVVAEVELGSTGSSASEVLTYLLVYRTEGKKLVSVLSKEIGFEMTHLNVEGKRVVTSDHLHYSLSRTKSLKPMIMIEDAPPIVIELGP